MYEHPDPPEAAAGFKDLFWTFCHVGGTVSLGEEMRMSGGGDTSSLIRCGFLVTRSNNPDAVVPPDSGSRAQLEVRQ